MTSQTPQQRGRSAPRPGQAEMVALLVLAAIALIGGAVLGIWSISIDGEGQPALQVGLAWWASLMLGVGAVATVGVIVLSGVRSMLRR